MAKAKNDRLKKANTEINFTQHQLSEVRKCINDPVYFIKNYVYLKHPVRGQLLFDLYDYQITMIHNLMGYKMNVALWPRQTGKSQTISAFLLWFCLFNSDKTVIITSNKGDTAMEIIDKIQFAYEELPYWLKIGIDDSSWNKHTCKFENRSRIISMNTSPDSCRGYSVSYLVSDEFAFISDHIQEEFFASVLPVISTGGSWCVLSTPSGADNKFAEIWRGAELGTNTFHPFTVPWNACPGRDEAFKQDIIANFGLIKWRQEYECQFISSDATLFDSQIVAKTEQYVKDQLPAFIIPKINNGEGQIFYKVLHRPSTYIVGIDPGTGSGADFSTIEVYEFPSLEQVMEYRSNTLSHPEFYNYIKNLLNWLAFRVKEVYWSVENNGVGQGVIALYQNDDTPPNGELVNDEGKDTIGMNTTDKNKISACLLMKHLYENNKMKLYSQILLKEMKNYRRTNGTYKAKTGATDDCISASLICLKIVKELASHDSKAYHLLYTANIDDSGKEWLKITGDIVDNNMSIEDDVDENEEMLPFSLG